MVTATHLLEPSKQVVLTKDDGLVKGFSWLETREKRLLATLSPSLPFYFLMHLPLPLWYQSSITLI